MKIQVLGSGCATCKRLFELVKQVASEVVPDVVVLYSDDIQQLIDMGVMQSPVLAINGVPVAVGSVPSPFKIKEFIQEALVNPVVVEKSCACDNFCACDDTCAIAKPESKCCCGGGCAEK
jgi:hypothetical protein